MHDTNMEGRERTWRERKERKRERKEKERKYAKTFQSSPKLAYIRYMYVYVSVFQESKSRYIEGIEGIGWRNRTASSSSK